MLPFLFSFLLFCQWYVWNITYILKLWLCQYVKHFEISYFISACHLSFFEYWICDKNMSKCLSICRRTLYIQQNFWMSKMERNITFFNIITKTSIFNIPRCKNHSYKKQSKSRESDVVVEIMFIEILFFCQYFFLCTDYIRKTFVIF